MEVDMRTHSRRARRRPFGPFVAAGLAAAVLLACSSPAGAAPEITAREVVTGLDGPVAFTFGPGRVLWYVEKTTGEIRTHDLDTGADRRFDVVAGVNGEGERGLLGIALHPDYPSEPFVFVYATRSVNGNLKNQILRITDRDGGGANQRVIFSSPASSSPYHNGGRISFGPDGLLYAIAGDGHDASNAQDLSRNDRGKILRMRPDGSVPATNPRDGLWFAYGIRNSFGFAFDPETGRLWETENGPACNDELNRIREGKNYGWGPSATCEGPSPGNTNVDGPNPVRPAWFTEPTIGITGIAFCDGCGLGSASEGRAFFGAVNDGEIRRVTLNERRTGARRAVTVVTHTGGVLSVEVGPRGSLYFSDFGGIYRLVRA
jgi:glucose/arabinose dehydrogenase